MGGRRILHISKHFSSLGGRLSWDQTLRKTDVGVQSPTEFTQYQQCGLNAGHTLVLKNSGHSD